jgi:hypothetical protein
MFFAILIRWALNEQNFVLIFNQVDKFFYSLLTIIKLYGLNLLIYYFVKFSSYFFLINLFDPI